MEIEVLLTPQEVDGIDSSTAPVITIAIDLLRATTVMVTACHIGVQAITPVSSLEDARQLYAENPSWFLAGEVHSLPPEGFHFGNSPLEIYEQRENLTGKNLIMFTTNGTRLLNRLEKSLSHLEDKILVGALVNLNAICKEILALGHQRVIFCCAGRKGEVSLEDTACAGYMIQQLMASSDQSFILRDKALLALSLVKAYSSPQEIFESSHHGQRLIGLGLTEDMAFCRNIDFAPVVPYYRKGEVSLLIRGKSSN
jgi:2-phosphosulfolactate phosphatase